MEDHQDFENHPIPAAPLASDPGEIRPQVRSLRELIDLVSGRNVRSLEAAEDAGLAEVMPFPFMAVVGQVEMKMALLLAVINPNIGGLLLIGPRGIGKTTAVRSLIGLLPEIRRSTCYYGCREEDVESGSLDAICPDCAQKFAEGKPLTKLDQVHLVELPLNSRLEDVIGGLDERALVHERLRLKRGILSQADQNILYIDEVNLLADEIIDSILDAAAQGQYTIRRGPISATYKAQFTLIGSMNPEEGSLRPQIMDRFGLRVLVRGLENPQERQEVYQRVRSYRKNPRTLISQFAPETEIALKEIQAARRLLPQVELPDVVTHAALELIRALQIDSSRAELTLLEAARAYAAADNRTNVALEDIRVVAPMALRLRRSAFMTRFFAERAQEEEELSTLITAKINP
jgi:magnesium chelatase subunit I